jgi:cobalt-zinc-cadmium resistance protein CzcA
MRCSTPCATNLAEGALFVVAVLFAFLGNLRAGLVVALAIPLAMLFAFSAMMGAGVAGSLHEPGRHRLRARRRQRGHHPSRTRPPPPRARPDAPSGRSCATPRSRSGRPTLFGELVIAIVYLPDPRAQGFEGSCSGPWR